MKCTPSIEYHTSHHQQESTFSLYEAMNELKIQNAFHGIFSSVGSRAALLESFSSIRLTCYLLVSITLFPLFSASGFNSTTNSKYNMNHYIKSQKSSITDTHEI